jgi:hypothetical protein
LAAKTNMEVSMNTFRRTLAASVLGVGNLLPHTATHAIDNSAIGQPEFREHKATFGLVFRLAKDVIDVLDAKIYPSLRERLVKLGLVAEARTFTLQHVTVVHIHNADPSTPPKMLIALPKEGLKYSAAEEVLDRTACRRAPLPILTGRGNTCGFPRLRQRDIPGLRAFRAFL